MHHIRRCITVALLLFVAARGRAQMVEVHLSEAASRAPIVGAVVRLLRDTTIVTQGLTTATGRAMLRAPAPGVYRIRVSRIGYAAVVSDTISVANDQTIVKDLAMSSIAISLSGLDVQSKSECGGPIANGALAGAIWDQVSTALAANVVSERQWAVPLQVQTFHRDLTLEGDSLREVVTGFRVVRGPPFASPLPAALAKDGFATLAKSGDMTFTAPDAALLLTDEFASTHCFRAVAGPTDSIVGLAFEPTPRRRLPDVRGTLWVNRQTSELRFIDYTYTNLPAKLSGVGLRGRIDFRRLVTGAWIVSYWHIRMPRMDIPPEDYRARRAFEPHLVGFVEDGGRVTVALTPGAMRAIVTGRVFDSTTSLPLADAVVRLQGDSGFATTEIDGRFTIATATGGPRTIVVTHPKLGLIDDGSDRQLNLSIGDSAVANFAVPTAARIAREFCGATQSHAGLVGLAWADGATAENLDVVVSWERTPGAPEEDRSQSGPRGVYVLCDLPAGQNLTVRIKRGDAVLVEKKLKLEANEFRWVELK